MENQHIQNWFQRTKPLIAVVSLQFGYAIMDILSKAAMNKGMSNYVFVVYRHAVAFIVLAPFALVLEKPVIDQNLYFLGMKYTTATFAVAMFNVVPAITFFFAWILRLEKIKIRSIRSQAKLVGTLATVGGAMVMTLMKGPILFGTQGGNNNNEQHNGTDTQHTIVGSVMIIIGSICWAWFVILQSITLNSYPAPLSLASLICLLGTVEGAAVAMIMERGNSSVWALKWDTSLLCSVYTGIVCSGLAYYLQGVVMKTRGPVYVTAFNPLCMVIVAVMGYCILAEQIFLGRVIGAVVICLGLYLVVWGKSKDYNTPNPIIQEPPILPVVEGNAKKEHCANVDTTKSDFGTRVTTRDEQV
ncbi:WAT1-related protein At2g37450-like isoform X2 [Gastrolobium bilobum]|uniref:WAT1-related protein At2g37450-like isoform X2 n=1 Tax=Gastrolobium bilobum TaxID=150636 RepID=UPI002AB31562|nr:WAT1-related protein At2g37450-like isoform X2 [Gastrolobium bilobum]